MYDSVGANNLISSLSRNSSPSSLLGKNVGKGSSAGYTGARKHLRNVVFREPAYTGQTGPSRSHVGRQANKLLFLSALSRGVLVLLSRRSSTTVRTVVASSSSSPWASSIFLKDDDGLGNIGGAVKQCRIGSNRSNNLTPWPSIFLAPSECLFLRRASSDRIFQPLFPLFLQTYFNAFEMFEKKVRELRCHPLNNLLWTLVGALM